MNGARRCRLNCVDVAQETPDIATFVFKATDGALPPFRAGQFLALDLPRAGHTPDRRSFTIASLPSRPNRLAVTVRAGEPGGATSEMRQALRAGATLDAEGPFDAFALREPSEHPLVMIFAGSGATPMLSMAR
jgi:ferredoxin-NADP reductase